MKETTMYSAALDSHIPYACEIKQKSSKKSFKKGK